MRMLKTTVAIAALGAALLTMPAGPAAAASMGSGAGALGLAAQQTTATHEIQYRYRHRGYYGPRYYRGYRGGYSTGAGVAAGIAAGALLGSAIAAQSAPRGYIIDERPSRAEIEYCMRRFKSYDLRSMTYLGYDGRRHSCP